MITRARAVTTIAAGAAAAAFPLRARAANQPLSTGQVGKSIAFFPIYVAAQMGYFTDAGLDVTTTIFQTGQLVGAAMTSGSVDVGTSLMTDVFALLKANRPTQVIGSLVDGYYVDIIASNKLMADTKTSRSSKLADKIRALKGKKIGITGPGSGTEALVVYLFKSAGLDTTRDAELVNVGADQASVIAALGSNRIDAVSFAWPLSMIAQAKGVGKPYIMPADGDVPSMTGQLHGCMYARPDVIAKKTDAIVAFVKAIGRAEALLHHDAAKRDALVRQYDPNLDEAATAQLMAAYLPVLPTAPRVSPAAYAKSLNFHQITGFAGPTGNTFGEVVDTALIQRAITGKG
jgi:ABC-type nitrate/sulfonate/bicarbonate transport system substrate-binding protein